MYRSSALVPVIGLVDHERCKGVATERVAAPDPSATVDSLKARVPTILNHAKGPMLVKRAPWSWGLSHAARRARPQQGGKKELTPAAYEPSRLALLIVASERRLYLNMLIASLLLKKPRSIAHVLVVDTSTVPRRWRGESVLASLGEVYETISLPGMSFHRVLRVAWSRLAEDVGATHVLMFEEDFVLLKDLPINRLLALADTPGTLQVVVPRQRWFEAEFQHRDRGSYLRAKSDFRVTPEGDRLMGYFTSNPHCMRLERILPLLEVVSPSDDYTWETEYAAAAASRGLNSLQIRSSRPWVWHIGAATALGVRTALASGESPWWTYLRAHAKRAQVIAVRRAPILHRD